MWEARNESFQICHLLTSWTGAALECEPDEHSFPPGHTHTNPLGHLASC